MTLLATTPHLLDKAAREFFGRSVKELLLERRLLEAKRLLMFTVRSVEDIADEIGFEDPAYFSRFSANPLATRRPPGAVIVYRENDDSAVQKARKRKLLDSDYVEGGFGSNLGLLKPWTADGADHPDPRGLTDKNVRLHHAANHNRLDCDCNAGGAGQHIRVPFRGTRKGTSCCILQFRSMRTKCGYVTTNVGDLS
ncbi:HTH DNA-binding domain-containing protein (plasmid) [Rhizobium phaseoli]|nr:HTH DNA-binding domain-containing protein [Rhizobium phaseoli]ANL44582.1 HTH DNA-binding domain-containing protein [Rhizobium phaseoli]ANL63546.1 HTH DNA-binding domain-containing protein [Rhizobium phaseoli]ANL69712.1 HTH DNA-binding domain-containing protein [Rhizobium phaseoli]ANL76152.1 HTH DNA-binding domain-containing protein [Rhizobium phaseoli]